MALLARLFAEVDGTSCQAEGNLSALGVTLDSLGSTMAADEVEQMKLLRLNEFSKIRAYEKELAKINGHVRAQKTAV